MYAILEIIFWLVLTEHQLGLGVQGTGAWTAMTPVNIPLMVVFCQSNMPALIN